VPNDSPQKWDALAAPAPYNSSAPENRIARILCTDGTEVFIDLLLRQVRSESPVYCDPDAVPSEWRPFLDVSAIAVGRPIVFRLANAALVTGQVRSIQWLGSVKEIASRDVTAMGIIGSLITQRRRPLSWWNRR
jgi:hypothetical protein